MVLAFDTIMDSFATNTTLSDNFTSKLKISHTNLPYVVTAAFQLIIVTLAFATNVLLIFVYARSSQLYTAFNIYLLCLSIADLLKVTLGSPLSIIVGIAGGIWPFSLNLCYLFLYTNWTFSALVSANYMILAMNRFWALMFPTHFKAHHTHAVAVGFCILTVLAAHGVAIPALVQAVSEKQCYANNATQVMWCVHVIFCLTVAFCGVVYPMVGYVVWERRRLVRPKRDLQTTLAMTSHTHEALEQTFGKESVIDFPSVIMGNHAENYSYWAHVTSGVSTSTSTQPTRRSPPQYPRKSRRCAVKAHFNVFSTLTAGVLTFWTPLAVYLTVNYFTDYTDPLAYAFVLTLQYVTSVMNPVLYVVTKREWRTAFRKIMGHK
ncbi:5-hydroxytryptamine receptor-like [Paramacrobiotus metropolitanus]|uniref:5-hydroxytryptamine receptor-like n=1 Tax=Paramacrobiotus metropolitanus TaxID=2943436 RepID=UPI0024457416|nr:5-hydroxytryptamine receptor-like [Paramacrobiotus metropolitanus]